MPSKRFLAPACIVLAIAVPTGALAQTSDSLFVTTGGDVGVGTETPDAALHVHHSDGDTQLHVEESSSTAALRTLVLLENNGGIRLQFQDHSIPRLWTFRTAGNNFVLDSDEITGAAMRLEGNGNMILQGEITTSGSCSVGCDRVFAPDYELPSIEDHASSMFESRHLPAVGPTPEDGPFNLSRKVGGMLNELEVAHIYIHQLAESNQALVTEVDRLREDGRSQTEMIDALLESNRELARRIQALEAAAD